MFTTIRYVLRDMPLGLAGIRVMKLSTVAIFLTMVLITIAAGVSTVAGGIDNTIKAIGNNPVGLVLWVVFAMVLGNLWIFFDELEEESRMRANKARYNLPALRR